MNFDLTELAATLAIGVFFLVGAAYAQLLSSGKPLGAALSKLSNTSQYFIAVIMAGCFVVGMILEDLSNKFVDDDLSLNWGVILVSDDEIKSRVFFGKDYRNNIHEAAPLSYLAAKYGLLGQYGGADGAALESHILQKKQCQPTGANPQLFQEVQLDKQVSNNVAKTFYYNAKSITYKDESYYNELKKIQMRIDFSRSLIAVSGLVMLLFIAGLGRTLFKLRRSWLPERWLSKSKDAQEMPPATLNDQSNSTQNNGRKFQKRRMLEFALILVVIFVAANFAYISEEMEFDKRVYGYYIYDKVNAETPATLICKEPTVIKTLVGTTH